MNTTISANKNTVERSWFKVDADKQILGRLATSVASVLRGKHKASFTPHVDVGDYVVIVNAEKIKVTGKKLKDARHYWHTGYPGGIKSASMEELLDKNSAEVLRRVIKGMLPKGPLGRAMLLKLKIYNDAEHPHVAQQLQDWPYYDDSSKS